MALRKVVRAPEPAARQGSSLARVFRVVGAAALFAISLNMVVCLARGTFSDAFALTPFAVALPIVLLAVWICRRAFLASLRSAPFKALFHLIFQAGLGLLIGAFTLYLLGYRHHARWDLSSTGLNELSSETRAILEGLTDVSEPVEMVLLEGEAEATPEERDQGERLRVRLQELLQAYRTAAEAVGRDKLSFRVLRMLEAPVELDLLAKRTGLTFTRAMSEGILLLRGERSKLVTKQDLFGPGAFTADRRALPTFQGEAAIATALRSLLQEKQKTVCYVVGHGEQDQAATSAFRKMLAGQNLGWQEVDLSTESRVPEAAAALVICGPRRAFSKDEIERVRAYLRQGGGLLVLVDPILPAHAALAGEACGLGPLLEGYGIVLRQDLMTRMSQPDVLGQPVPVDRFPALPNRQCASPLLEAIRAEEAPVIFSIPCVVQAGADAVGAGRVCEVLLQGLERGQAKAWACSPSDVEATRKGPGEGGLAAPVPLAVWSAPPEKGKTDQAGRGPRLVALAGSRVLTNPDFQPHPGNQIFLRACLRWLVGEDELVATRQSEDPAVPIATIDFEQGGFLLVLLVLGLPGALAFLGVIVWNARRN